MKKNWMLRAGVLMLVLALITSCFVGGTFAKYATEGESKDTARVAMFGVTISTAGQTFAEAYQTDDKGITSIANSVLSAGGDDVVAPGTKGYLAKTLIEGTPEVAVKVQHEVTVEMNDEWKDANGDFYCPLQFFITEYPDYILKPTVNGANYDNKEDLIQAIEAQFGHSSTIYAPGYDLENSDTLLNAKWVWPFEGEDESDTYLGNQAAKGHAATISMTVTTTVTQVD